MRADGKVYGLSNSPDPFVYNGLKYQAAIGADMSQLEDYAGTEVGSAEATLPIDDVVAYLSTQDVTGLRFENSRWTVYLIDCRNPGNGAMILASYRLNRTQFTDSHMVMDLLALLSFFKTVTGRAIRSLCDVAQFADIRCDPSRTILAAYSDPLTVSAYVGLFYADFSLSPRAAGFYSAGRAIWTSGNNAGLQTPIKQHTTVSGKTRVRWRTPPPFAPSAGDAATLVFGCDRRIVTCKTVLNPHNPSGTNAENNQSFYQIPSQDEIQVINKNF